MLVLLPTLSLVQKSLNKLYYKKRELSTISVNK